MRSGRKSGLVVSQLGLGVSGRSVVSQSVSQSVSHPSIHLSSLGASELVSQSGSLKYLAIIVMSVC